MSTLEKIAMGLIGLAVIATIWKSQQSAGIINAIAGGGSKLIATASGNPYMGG